MINKAFNETLNKGYSNIFKFKKSKYDVKDSNKIIFKKRNVVKILDK